MKGVPERRDGRMSYSGENSCAIVPEEFSGEFLVAHNSFSVLIILVT